MQKKSESRYFSIFTLFFLSFIFFLLRLDTFGHVYANGYLKLIDPDSYYHLRRILFTFNNYPKILSFDAFLSFPSGDFVPWPPLFDLLSATIAKIFQNTELVLPLLDPIYFYLGFLLIFFALKKKEDERTVIISCFFLASAEILRIYTSFGRLDHHAIELFIITAIYITFSAYLNKKSVTKLLLFTTTILAAFFNWPGSVIYFPPLIFFIFYRLYRGERDQDLFKGLFIAFHITAIVIAVYLRLTGQQDYPPYSYKFLSGFQRDFCFFVSIVFFNIYLTLKTKIKPAIIWISAATILFGLFHRFVFELLNGFSYVGKIQPIFVLAEETAPLFFSKFYSLGEEFKRANTLFTPLFFLFPLIFFLYLKRRGIDILFLCTIYFLVFTFFQLRFGYFFMTGYSVMLGVTLSPFLKQIKKGYILLIAGVITIFTFYSNQKHVSGRFENQSLYNAMRFLKEKTPDKEDFSKGTTPYGILSSWHLGHYIIQLGERPAVAHNFIGVSPKNDERAFIRALV